MGKRIELRTPLSLTYRCSLQWHRTRDGSAAFLHNVAVRFSPERCLGNRQAMWYLACR